MFVFLSVCVALLRMFFCYLSLSVRSYEWMSSGAHARKAFRFINKASMQPVTWLISEVCSVDLGTKDHLKAVPFLFISRFYYYYYYFCMLLIPYMTIQWWHSVIDTNFIPGQISFAAFVICVFKFYLFILQQQRLLNSFSNSSFIRLHNNLAAVSDKFLFTSVHTFVNILITYWTTYSEIAKIVKSLIIPSHFFLKPADLSTCDDGSWIKWTATCLKAKHEEETEQKCENGRVFWSTQV